MELELLNCEALQGKATSRTGLFISRLGQRGEVGSLHHLQHLPLLKLLEYSAAQLGR